ncbi:hypothetical protein KHA90_16585 [Flavobacterium psychroterrae]|uniref:tRNA nuclease CdiA C-terminal domain-containing protein n=1 Tax=Flavobacterium psychroterrae TaxID=2133767 RepID=A0ABS5PEC7_9FLAO|nr:hypothetical protein [Flavobacterium psychroterrae]MBS7232637.1 hypothetical protein [Flavobacterium psychroterrae]
MHNSFDELIEAHQDCCSKSKVASENGKRFEIVSNEDFTKIRIDDYLIPSKKVQKCDFGFVRHSNDEFYFVELKGKDVKIAVEQIISTINIFESTIVKVSKEKRFGFIVSSRNPLSSAETNNLKQAFAKKHGRILEIKSVQCKYVPK